jgi:integral membrane protein
VTTAPAPLPATAEPTALRALRVVAAVEGISFVILLVCSILKRTTDFNAVPVMGPVHGVLFLSLVVLVVVNWARLGWAPWFAVVMLTVGSPGAHFAVHATRIRQA